MQIIAKKSNLFMGGEYVKVCVMKAVGIFFFRLPNGQLWKTTPFLKTH